MTAILGLPSCEPKLRLTGIFECYQRTGHGVPGIDLTNVTVVDPQGGVIKQIEKQRLTPTWDQYIASENPLAMGADKSMTFELKLLAPAEEAGGLSSYGISLVKFPEFGR